MGAWRTAAAGLLTGILACGTAAGSSLPERPLTPGGLRPVPSLTALEADSDTSAAEAASETDKASYEDTSPWQDFEVHFLVSLPFTGLYGYLTVASLDAVVQGAFPTELHQADLWVVIGLALGSSLAVALGSAGRVPDQSQPRLDPAQPPAGSANPAADSAAKLPLVVVRY